MYSITLCREVQVSLFRELLCFLVKQQTASPCIALELLQPSKLPERFAGKVPLLTYSQRKLRFVFPFLNSHIPVTAMFLTTRGEYLPHFRGIKDVCQLFAPQQNESNANLAEGQASQAPTATKPGG